ncbi:MAG: hypothetical protein ABI646_04905 [Acidobacteriota bacterium]
MLRKLTQVAIPFIWFGMIAAISFMEAPLKFQAPGITLPLGLGVGRLIFFALNKIEIVLAGVFLLSLLGIRPLARAAVVIFACISLILVLETVWLLPVLDVRAEQVIAGTAKPFSNLHLFYIAFDAVKLILLFVLGTLMFRLNLRSE